jgi:Protein of unknown function (DUF2934)
MDGKRKRLRAASMWQRRAFRSDKVKYKREVHTSDEEIRRRAYEIYLERGEQSDTELDDWLQAERELEQGVL